MKDYLRDYATAAFRFYASNGRSAEAFKKKIYDEALEKIRAKETQIKSGISKPTEEAIMAAEQAVNDKIAEVKDMEAVERVLDELKVNGGGCIIAAIEIVYFSDWDKELLKGDIKNRVIRASLEIPASERAIYSWLKHARTLFAYQRGLRIYKFRKRVQ